MIKVMTPSVWSTQFKDWLPGSTVNEMAKLLATACLIERLLACPDPRNHVVNIALALVTEAMATITKITRCNKLFNISQKRMISKSVCVCVCVCCPQLNRGLPRAIRVTSLSILIIHTASESLPRAMIFLSLRCDEPFSLRSVLQSPTCWFTRYQGQQLRLRLVHVDGKWVMHGGGWTEGGGHSVILDRTSSSQEFPVPPSIHYYLPLPPVSFPLLSLGVSLNTPVVPTVFWLIWGCVCVRRINQSLIFTLFHLCFWSLQ